MKDLKYLLAYLVPCSAFVAVYCQGIWSWTTIVLVFGLIPLLELVAPKSAANVAPEEEQSRSDRRFFDFLLFANLPLVYGLLLLYLDALAHQALHWSEWLGLTLGVGVVIGASGINVAHELGHRNSPLEQNLAKWLLLPALYQHFFVEHNRGHHKNVATELDPASARKGEYVFFFWVQSITGGWKNAWKLEQDRLEKLGLPAWSWQNAVLRFLCYQLAWLLAVGCLFGLNGAIGACSVALIGILLLETVNYLEHYGLRRKRLPSGHYEPVGPQHSWNSDHEIGRIMLYELTRHSDHHYKSTRKYQILRHIDESPQLPVGYPTAVLLCLIPPLWFAMMDKRV